MNICLSESTAASLWCTPATVYVMVRRFLIVWSSFLPFALYSRFQWLTPFVAAIITFLLFGVCISHSPTSSARAHTLNSQDLTSAWCAVALSDSEHRLTNHAAAEGHELKAVAIRMPQVMKGYSLAILFSPYDDL